MPRYCLRLGRGERLSGHGDAPALLEEIRETFGLAAVSLLERRRDGAGPRWYVTASAGDHPPDSPAAEVSLPVTETVTLAACGQPLSGADARVLASCAVPLVADLIRRRQDEQDAHAAWQAADAHSRSALLAATGHQAGEQLKKADDALAVLADPSAVITPGERATRAAAARRAVARLSMLLTDLKGLRRLQTGALETYLRPVDLDEVLAAALEDLGPGGPAIILSVPEDLPDVIADADLLTRILTGLTAEALHRSPPGLPAEDVELRTFSNGQYAGRFMLTPKPGSKPSQRARLVAVALADLAGHAVGDSSAHAA